MTNTVYTEYTVYVGMVLIYELWNYNFSFQTSPKIGKKKFNTTVAPFGPVYRQHQRRFPRHSLQTEVSTNGNFNFHSNI